MRVDKPLDIAVSLRLDIMPGREQLTGILRFVKERSRNWNLHLKTGKELVDDISNCCMNSKGYILSETPPDAVTSFLATTSIPTVTIDTPSELFDKRRYGITAIELDNAMIGRMGAAHFQSKGRYRTLAFVLDRNSSHWAEKRCSAFAKSASENGIPCCIFNDGNGIALHKWLARLPKPIGMMVACDRRMAQVLEACQEARLDIPEQVAILGVDNESMYCNYTRPSLSSIDPGLEEEGFKAAAELDSLLNARYPRPCKQLFLPPLRVVERESTAVLLPAVALIKKATAFINGNVSKRIKVPDVVREMKVSRSLAELRFRQIQGESIRSAIENRRLSMAKRLIENTDCRILEIVNSCGFSNRRQMERAFLRRFGESISSWRKKRRLRTPAATDQIKI